MSGVIFRHTLRHSWRQALYWGIGIALLGFYVIAAFPNVEVLEQYASLLESFPPAMLRALGVADAAGLATPEGFITYGFTTWALLLMAVYGMLAGMNLVANEEEAGILDLLLSLPLPRWRLLLGRFAAYGIMALGITLLSGLAMVLAHGLTALELDDGRLVLVALWMTPAALVSMAFTALAASALRRHSMALGAGILFVIGSYFLDFLAAAISEGIIADLGQLSFFHHAAGDGLLAGGALPSGSLALLLLVSGALLAGALWFLERRDIGL